MQADLGLVLKAAYPKVVATLTRVLGDMDQAMDATQDALVKALQSWPKSGVPDSPVAWLVTVGRNRGIDHIRRSQRVVGLDNVVSFPGEAPDSDALSVAVADELSLTELDDDMLRLMFTCCHPILSSSQQITLMMKVVLGFSVDEIARSLLTSRASIEKRITRSKNALKQAGVEYAVPRGIDIGARLDAVLQAVYLLFNEGYTRLQNGEEDQRLARNALVNEAIRLARMVCRLLRRNPEPRALLALMLLSAARLPARMNAQGWLVPLAEQDRSLWDQNMSREGIALVDAVFAARHPPSAYQIQAAISALHNRADSSANTDWQQIVGLYSKLREYDPSPVVPVNEAVAMCMAGQPEAAYTQLRSCQEEQALTEYQPYYAALAYVAEQCTDQEAARAYYRKAIDLAQSAAQKAYLNARLERLG